MISISRSHLFLFFSFIFSMSLLGNDGQRPKTPGETIYDQAIDLLKNGDTKGLALYAQSLTLPFDECKHETIEEALVAARLLAPLNPSYAMDALQYTEKSLDGCTNKNEYKVPTNVLVDVAVKSLPLDTSVAIGLLTWADSRGHKLTEAESAELRKYASHIKPDDLYALAQLQMKYNVDEAIELCKLAVDKGRQLTSGESLEWARESRIADPSWSLQLFDSAKSAGADVVERERASFRLLAYSMAQEMLEANPVAAYDTLRMGDALDQLSNDEAIQLTMSLISHDLSRSLSMREQLLSAEMIERAEFDAAYLDALIEKSQGDPEQLISFADSSGIDTDGLLYAKAEKLGYKFSGTQLYSMAKKKKSIALRKRAIEAGYNELPEEAYDFALSLPEWSDLQKVRCQCLDAGFIESFEELAALYDRAPSSKAYVRCCTQAIDRRASESEKQLLIQRFMVKGVDEAKENLDKAVSYLEVPATHGEGHAALWVAELVSLIDPSQDQKIIKYLEKAHAAKVPEASQKLLDAYLKLGSGYITLPFDMAAAESASKDKHKKAVSWYSKALGLLNENHQHYYDVQLLLGISHKRLGNYEEALCNLKIAEAHEQLKLQACENIAEIFQEMNKVEDAIKKLEESIDLGSVDANVVLAERYLQYGNGTCKQEPIRAAQMLIEAFDAGNQKARQAVARIKKDFSAPLNGLINVVTGRDDIAKRTKGLLLLAGTEKERKKACALLHKVPVSVLAAKDVDDTQVLMFAQIIGESDSHKALQLYKKRLKTATNNKIAKLLSDKIVKDGMWTSSLKEEYSDLCPTILRDCEQLGDPSLTIALKPESAGYSDAMSHEVTEQDGIAVGTEEKIQALHIAYRLNLLSGNYEKASIVLSQAKSLSAPWADDHSSVMERVKRDECYSPDRLKKILDTGEHPIEITNPDQIVKLRNRFAGIGGELENSLVLQRED